VTAIHSPIPAIEKRPHRRLLVPIGEIYVSAVSIDEILAGWPAAIGSESRIAR
jgi:hypothetical protein